MAMKHQLEYVYTTSTARAAQILNDYYRDENPIQKANDYSSDLYIESVLQRSDKTWQIE